MSQLGTGLEKKGGVKGVGVRDPQEGAELEERVLASKWDAFDVLDVKQVAEILGVSHWTVWEQAKIKALPFIRIGRRHVMSRYRLIKLLKTGE